jgi:iron uptake system component EfeO
MRAHLLLSLPVAALLAACGGSSASSTGSGGDIAVSAGDTTCDVARTSLDAGKHTFAVKNTGGDVTEVYVYAKGSSGTFNRIVGEVENIAPSTSRDFAVTLGGGEYEVACKPGQKGDGIRTKLTVSGASAATEEAYDREVEVEATDFAFKGLESFAGKVGEKIEFKLQNKSTSNEHELEIFGPDGKAIGEVGPTKPGADGEVVLELVSAGTYTYKSGIGDDEAKGMKGTFTVS